MRTGEANGSMNRYIDDETEDFKVPQFHHNEDLDETGVSQVIIERFVNHRLPLLMEIRDDMLDGRRLSDGELEIMQRVVDRAHSFRHFVYEYPELKDLVGKVIALYDEITTLALSNEQKPAE